MKDKKEQKPFILDVKSNDLDDGPGVRTSVFFKGCPLFCIWCHNPESKKIINEIVFDESLCIGCNRCLLVCQPKALDRKNKYYVDRNKCTLCFKCADVCPTKAIAPAGQYKTIDELYAKIAADKIFYDISGGGVTLTGGEVTLFPDFAGSLLKKCKEGGIHTLIETCGYFDYDEIEQKMLPYIDAIYFDLKIWQEEEHQKYCGASNKKIHENFIKLMEYSRAHDLDVLVRIPLIPEISDTDENLEGIAGFLKENNVKRIVLLPYNPTWYPKNAKLGLDNPQLLKDKTTWQSQNKIDHCKQIFISKDIKIV